MRCVLARRMEHACAVVVRVSMGSISEALIIAGTHLYMMGCETTDTMIAMAAVELASQLFDIGIGLGGKHASFYLEIYE